MSTAFASIPTTANPASLPSPLPLTDNVVSIGTRSRSHRSFTPAVENASVFAFEPSVDVKDELIALSPAEEVNKNGFAEIIGNSPALKGVLALAEKVASWDSTVLLLGETGTGKELVARAIHRSSDRAHKPLIKVNCAALPAELIASELFGHEKGAFTGAMQQRIGRFEAANGGTIFLDEIAELSPEIQVALLRVLQEKEFERVGGNRTIKTDVRVIAATNKDLRQEVAAGRFRTDLFFRLNVFPISVPALRERVDDIPLLVEFFAGRFGERCGKPVTHIEKRSLTALRQHSWPGNVRELQNVIERCMILADGDILRIDPSMLTSESQPNCAPVNAQPPSDRRSQIEAVLRQTRGKVYGPNGAAARLHIAGTTLDSQIAALGIRKYQFK